jgi:hypothetical protein
MPHESGVVMEALLYFSKQHVRLRDLTQLADKLGYRHEYVDVAADGEEWLNIYYEDERFWQWIPLLFKAEDPAGNRRNVPSSRRLRQLPAISSRTIPRSPAAAWLPAAASRSIRRVD